MANEKETQQNAVAKVGSSLLSQQDFFVGQISNLFAKQNVPLTKYQVTCGNNAVAKMVQMANASNKDIFSYPQAQTLFTLQNIIANEWDVLQGEGVIIFQNKKITTEAKDKNGNPVMKDGKVVMTTKYEQYFDLRPTAKGHIKSIRMYGAGLNKANAVALSYVVYEGDDFEDISYVGIEVTPPKYRPKRLSSKIKFVVYALNMIDGTIQYVVGRREQVIPALVAQAKNNGAPETDLNKMMELGTVDKILDEFEIKTFEKPKYNPQTKKWEKEQVPYFNDTWIAGYNREQMLETKLRGVIANRMIDKEFNNDFQKQAFETVIVEKPKEKQLAKDRAEKLDVESTTLIEEQTFKVDPRSSKDMVIIEEETHEPSLEETQDVEEPKQDESEFVVETTEEPKKEDEKPQTKGTDLFDLSSGF
jgi:hypothetical protein